MEKCINVVTRPDFLNYSGKREFEVQFFFERNTCWEKRANRGIFHPWSTEQPGIAFSVIAGAQMTFLDWKRSPDTDTSIPPPPPPAKGSSLTFVSPRKCLPQERGERKILNVGHLCWHEKTDDAFFVASSGFELEGEIIFHTCLSVCCFYFPNQYLKKSMFPQLLCCLFLPFQSNIFRCCQIPTIFHSLKNKSSFKKEKKKRQRTTNAA